MSQTGKFLTMFGLGAMVVGSYAMTIRNATKNAITDDDIAEAMERRRNQKDEKAEASADAAQFIREAEERRRKRDQS